MASSNASAPSGENAQTGSAASAQFAMPPAAAQQQQQQEGNTMNSASLYVGDLHPEVTEALLFDIFNAVGPVASIRVCRDVATRRSLGYAYVNFHNQTDAERALDTMNYTLIKGQPCRIMWSQRDPSLRKNGAGNVFVKNLDTSIDNKALFDTFSLFGDILSCKVVTDKNGGSRGYGFVHFETPEAAQEAVAKINGMLIAGREVYVGPFLKRTDRPGMNDWTNVFVKNIPEHWDKDRLEKEFSACGPVSSAIVMTNESGQSRGFGFVDFIDHDSADKAVKEWNEKVVLTKLGEETGPEESDGEDDATAANQTPDKEAEEYYVEKKDGTVPDEGKTEKNADGTEKRKRKPKKTSTLFVGRAQKKAERERELNQKFESLKNERANKFAATNCFVKNLHEDVDDELLRKEFSEYGIITSARVMRENSSGDKSLSPSLGPVDPAAPAVVSPAPATDGETAAPKSNLPASKGFGFVCFSSPEEATRAITEMNGKLVLGKPIYVALAQPRDARRAQLEAHHGQRKGLQIVKSCIRALPGATNVACFDTQFHSSIPEHIRTYPINQDIAKSNKLRKYGFHGISYAFITRSVAKFLGKSPDKTNIIALHLGSGASACAIKDGKSWDTSMGLTPLAGLPGATRSGSVDPSLVFHYASDVGKLSPSSTKELHISRAEEILNTESGWKALAGTTNFGTIASSSDPAAQLAFDLFVDRVCAFVGTYYVSLRGEVDALVFAGGIGEHSSRLRAAIGDAVRCLGFEVEPARNEEAGEDVVWDVGSQGGGTAAGKRVLVCRTDEQFEMARACAHDEQLW